METQMDYDDLDDMYTPNDLNDRNDTDDPDENNNSTKTINLKKEEDSEKNGMKKKLSKKSRKK